jgi:hypothetical protein
MELDDLKKTWQENTIQKPQNKNIMEMIMHKSYGPLAALRRSYLKQILVMALMPFLLLLTNADNIQAPLTSILFWSYVALCIGRYFVFVLRLPDRGEDAGHGQGS